MWECGAKTLWEMRGRRELIYNMDPCQGEGLFQTPGLGDVNKANCKPISSHRSLLRLT